MSEELPAAELCSIPPFASPAQLTTLPHPMKAERRHQLQENSLVRNVRNFPEFWRAYGSKILLGIILILLAILLIRMWINKRAETRKQMAEELFSARAMLEN